MAPENDMKNFDLCYAYLGERRMQNRELGGASTLSFKKLLG